MIVDYYRDHRIDVNAVSVGDRWNAEVRIRQRCPRTTARRDGHLLQAARGSRRAQRPDLGAAVD